MNQPSSNDRELLVFLAAKVTFLEGAIETLLSHLPAIYELALSDPSKTSDDHKADSKRISHVLIQARIAHLKASFEHLSEQFPNDVEIIREHLDLAHKKIGEMYGDRDS
jgi:tRNA U34 5-carboxymethylaminomethyl modifying GTPase MnmE/TrmE